MRKALLKTCFPVVCLALLGCVEDQKVSVTAINEDLNTLSAALKFYRLDCGGYPSSEAGLATLLTPEGDSCSTRLDAYLSSLPKDPWGNRYFYRKLDADDFELSSLGEDGRKGGKGAAADIRLSK